MGGRGASSGTSTGGRRYGTQQRTLLTSGNIKFVQRNSGDSETIVETMTKGRVYANIDSSGNLSSITYFDNENKRSKQIDIRHWHGGKSPHVHEGYTFSRGSQHSARGLSSKEKAMFDRVKRIWEEYRRGQ